MLKSNKKSETTISPTGMLLDDSFRSDNSDCTTEAVAPRQQALHKEANATTSQPRRGVSFNPSVHVRCTLSVDHYSEEEKEACWYSIQDYDRIRRKSMKIIHRMIEHQDNNIDNDQTKSFPYCTRGLEHYHPAAHHARQERRDRFADAVFLLHGDDDASSHRRRQQVDRALATLCLQRISQQAQQLAIERAAHDEATALKKYDLGNCSRGVSMV